MKFKDKIYIMGILNVTEDSFFDGNKYFEKNKAIEHGLKIIEDGADILDIGGESTKPHSIKVSPYEEISRVVDIISEIRRYKDVDISIDTYKSEVAKEALKAGANIINDVYGGIYDEEILNVSKEHDSYICITHNRLNNINNFSNIVDEVYSELENQCTRALSKGLSRDKIIIDLGFGFSKYGYNNIVLLREINRFKDLGFPILIGVSRKKFLNLLDNKEPKENISSTISTNCFGVVNGANIIRVHDVCTHREIISCLNTILYGGDLSE